jgi:hypothetical protein
MSFFQTLSWEIIKFRKNNQIVIIPLATFLALLLFLFLFTQSFGKNFFNWVNNAEVKNTLEYFFTRLNFLTGLIFSLILVFSANIIYQTEIKYHTYHKLIYSEIPIYQVLNSKLFLHMIYMLLLIIFTTILILVYSKIIEFRYSDYSHYSSKFYLFSYFEVLILFVVKCINCCFIIRIFFHIIKNKLLHFVAYILIILNNILFFKSTPFNFFYTPQINFSTTLFIAIAITFILSILIIYEKRIFKT